MRRAMVSVEYTPILREYGLQDLALHQLFLLRFHRGEYLYRNGAAMEYLMLAVHGRAKVCRASESGKNLLFTFYRGAGLLGDIELMLGLGTATSDVQAISSFTAIGIPYSLAQTLLDNHPFVLRLARELAHHIDRNTQNSVATVLNPLEARLCSYISIMSVDGYFQETLTVLAELMGASYRHLHRTLNKLCVSGILCKSGTAYRVTDEDALKRLGGDAYQF